MRDETTRLRERPIGDLLASFAHDTSTLLSQEIELARAEVAVQAKYARVFIIGLTLQLVLRFRPEGILPERQPGSPPHR